MERIYPNEAAVVHTQKHLTGIVDQVRQRNPGTYGHDFVNQLMAVLVPRNESDPGATERIAAAILDPSWIDKMEGLNDQAGKFSITIGRLGSSVSYEEEYARYYLARAAIADFANYTALSVQTEFYSNDPKENIHNRAENFKKKAAESM